MSEAAPAPVSPAVQPILDALGHARFSLELQCTGLTQEEATRRARGDAGASVAWVVGHLACYRCTLLSACGIPTDNPYAEQFEWDKPATDGAGYPSIESLYADWQRLTDQLEARLRTLTDEELAADAGGRSLLAALSFHMFHEAYHIGTAGMIRVGAGKKHTHILALEKLGILPPSDNE